MGLLVQFLAGVADGSCLTGLQAIAGEAVTPAVGAVTLRERLDFKPKLSWPQASGTLQQFQGVVDTLPAVICYCRCI